MIRAVNLTIKSLSAHQRLSIYIVTHVWNTKHWLWWISHKAQTNSATNRHIWLQSANGFVQSRGCEVSLPLQISFSWLHYAFKHFEKAIRHTLHYRLKLTCLNPDDGEFWLNIPWKSHLQIRFYRTERTGSQMNVSHCKSWIGSWMMPAQTIKTFPKEGQIDVDSVPAHVETWGGEIYRVGLGTWLFLYVSSQQLVWTPTEHSSSLSHRGGTEASPKWTSKFS